MDNFRFARDPGAIQKEHMYDMASAINRLRVTVEANHVNSGCVQLEDGQEPSLAPQKKQILFNARRIPTIVRLRLVSGRRAGVNLCRRPIRN